MLRRILLVLTVAALMAVMVVANAGPAFAAGGGTKDPCKFSEGTLQDCRGGEGSGGDGSGGGSGGTYFAPDINDPTVVSTRGGGGGGDSGLGGGGIGRYCDLTTTGNVCHGGGSP
jgi:hypothetical protein